MQVLLRQLRQLPDGQLEYQDTELAADELLIGSAPQCQIQWVGEGIAPRHASLHDGAGGAEHNLARTYTTASTPALATLAGQPAAGAWRLRVVDRVAQDQGKLNGWRLLIKPPTA